MDESQGTSEEGGSSLDFCTRSPICQVCVLVCLQTCSHLEGSLSAGQLSIKDQTLPNLDCFIVPLAPAPSSRVIREASFHAFSQPRGQGAMPASAAALPASDPVGTSRVLGAPRASGFAEEWESGTLDDDDDSAARKKWKQ
jgi:hypothetical protein